MSDEFVLREPGTKEPQSQVLTTKHTSTLEGWKEEIGVYYQVMKAMVDMQPDDVFRSLSSFSARASEMRSQIPALRETREQSSFRIRVLDPFIDECDRQFKVHSRLQAIREMDARLAGGQFA